MHPLRLQVWPPSYASTPEGRWITELTREQERYLWAEMVRSYEAISELQDQTIRCRLRTETLEGVCY